MEIPGCCNTEFKSTYLRPFNARRRSEKGEITFFSTLLLQFFHLMKFQRPEPCRGQGSRLSRVRWRNSDFIK